MIFNRKYIYKLKNRPFSIQILVYWNVASILFEESTLTPCFFLLGLYAMAQGVNSAMVLASGYSSRRGWKIKMDGYEETHQFSTYDLFANFGHIDGVFFFFFSRWYMFL